MQKKLTTVFLGVLLSAASLATTSCMEVAQAQTPAAAAPGAPACAQGALPTPTRDEVSGDTTSSPAYVIGKNDVIRILVEPEVNFLENQKCSKDYTVQADGRINFCNLRTPQMADSRTAGELQAQLRKALIDEGIYVDVSVTVDITTYRAQSVYITGPVKQPGTVQLQGRDMTIMRAVNQAGGWQADAGSEVWLLRPPPEAPAASVTLDSPRLQEKKMYYRKHLTDNLIDPAIQAGDTIYVSPAEYVMINGEVRSYGQKVWEPCMTVGDVINLANGLNEKGSLGRSHISRKHPTKNTFEKIGKLKLETPVLPKDTIVIGKKLL